MKHSIKAAAASFVMTASATGLKAAGWTPPGPSNLMITSAAGGAAKPQARIIAENLEATLGWQCIPEQIPATTR
ncbi:hypothetical protein [Sulfitobacter sp.]|uniref:hypothetical protein n=1 Tax=Sulfitobacter sp. TaxID=1903071 RepID=UPI003001BD3A